MKAFYLRDKQNTPVALVLVETIDDDKVNSPAIHFAVATWHPDDAYNKTMGYHIAARRLELGKSVSMVVSPHVKRRVIEYIAKGDDPAKFGRYLVSERPYLHEDKVMYPRRTRAAAQLWLDVNGSGSSR